MDVEKIRNLGDDELALEARKTGEQLFRLRFQMKLGQTEGVKKLRELRKDIARIKTVERERQLGLHIAPASKIDEGAAAKQETAPVKHARKKTAKPARRKTAAKKSAASRKTASRKTKTTRRSAARPSANKKKASRSTSVKKG